MVGYRPVNGSSDPECTHVILTLDEYDELYQRIRAAINDGKRAKDEAARAAATSAANAEKAVKKIQADAAQEIAQLEKKVDKHNNFAERLPVVEEQIKVINYRLEDIEEYEKNK